jgi:pilus assembly protein FimV
VEKRASGQPFIKITSNAPVNEPFLDMLIEVSWPAGRLQREYPILLDPPGYSNKSVPPTVAAAPSRGRRQPAGLRAGGVFSDSRSCRRRPRCHDASL